MAMIAEIQEMFVGLWKDNPRMFPSCAFNIGWIRGHNGHPQQELVDMMARKVARIGISSRSVP